MENKKLGRVIMAKRAECSKNLRLAIIKIGKINPQKLKYTSKKNHWKKYDPELATDKDLFKMGLANVYKIAHNRLSKRKIRFSSKVNILNEIDVTKKFACFKCPIKEFDRIICIVYNTLEKYDEQYLLYLSKISKESGDTQNAPKITSLISLQKEIIVASLNTDDINMNKIIRALNTRLNNL